MLGGKKILGLCLTKIQDRVRGDLVNRINNAAVSAGFKLVCYNSFEDFYRTGIFHDGGQLYDQCRTWRYWDIRTVTSDQDEISFGTVEPDDIHFSIC